MSAKYALVIGNTEYSDPKLAQLSAPGKDAEAFAQLLKAPDLASFDDVSTLINQPSYEARAGIARFLRNRKPDDLLVLYFSGHGVRDEQGRLFLATKDTDSTILDATAIPSDFITRLMDNCRSKRQVLILDCCNSGAFAYGTKAATGAAMGTASAFEGNGYGRVVLTATDSTQFAYEGDQVMGSGTSDSLFTHFLIKGLEGEADSNGDGVISVDELYDYASGRIRDLTPNQQPEKFAYHQQEQLILTTRIRPQTVKPLPLNDPDLEVDLQSTRPYTREGAVRELGAILNGKNLGRALTAEERLKAMIDSDDSRSVIKVAQQILADYYAAHGVPAQPVEPKAVPLPATMPQALGSLQTSAPVVPTSVAAVARPSATPPLPVPAAKPAPEGERIRPAQAEPLGERVRSAAKPAQAAAAAARKLPIAVFARLRQRLGTPALIGIGVLLAAVLGAAIYVAARNPSAPAPIPTAKTNPTAARAAASAMSATQWPTSTPKPAPTDIPVLPHLLLSDDFTTNSQKWWTGPASDQWIKGTVSMSGGEYVWDVTAKQGFVYHQIPDNARFVSDFSVDTTAMGQDTAGSKGKYGVVLRYTSEGSNNSYYYFGIENSYRRYGFYVYYNGEWTPIVDWTYSSLINTGQYNDIRVVGRGPQFTFYVNGHYLGQASDATLTSGQCGLAVELATGGDAATFRFEDFELRTTP